MIDLRHVEVNFRFKKTSIFPLSQKANSLTFCAKISSDLQIWLNRHWNRVEWTQEMVFNIYHHTRTCLDTKIEIDEKKFQNYFFITNFLMGYFKALLENLFSATKNLFRFLIKILYLILRYHRATIPEWKTPKSWFRNKIPWLSDKNSRKEIRCSQLAIF